MCCCLFSGVGMVAVSCRDIAPGDSETCISHLFPCRYTCFDITFGEHVGFPKNLGFLIDFL